MTKTSLYLLTGLFILMPAVVRADGDIPADAPKYTLRYRFHPGQAIRWDVMHRSKIDTTISGTTKTAETLSKSVKLWRIQNVNPDGSATFVHLVESVDMRQNLPGCAEVCYNSRTDKEPPAGFQHVAQAVGVPLSVITMDTQGKIIRRVHKAGKSGTGQITISLPEQPIAVGYTWSFPHEIDVKTNRGTIKKIKTRQVFSLVSVKTGVATISVATQVLTPINDPALESQLIEQTSSGTVRFDIDAGRVIGQQMDVDKRLVGYPNPASSLHYLTRFTEKLVVTR